MISRLKQAAKDSGKSNKQIAELTGVSESTVSRYLSGEQSPPFEFVAKLAEILGLSLDELTGNPAGARRTAENTMLEQLRAVYEQRIEDKNAHISSQKNRIEKMEAAHAAEIERIQRDHDRELAERKRSQTIKDILLVIAFAGLIFYLIWDLTHPTEGMIQYQMYAAQGLSKLTGVLSNL